MKETCLRRLAGMLAVLVWAAVAAAAQPGADVPIEPAPEPGADQLDSKKLLDLDIEQLSQVSVKRAAPSMDVEVTSVAKQESTVGRSPAAIFVVTQEMIRRSGATSIPEVLRMVPGLEVARVNASSWAITARGFNGYFTGKMLVLIDGRIVYNPVTTGVYWDVQDYVLEDIERIEVIRGPGGTLWGANAVNGVINIITKNAKDTQGVLIDAGGGSEDRSINNIRYGGQASEGLSWRVYGKHFERGTGYDPAGAADDWRMGRGGFRLDWEPDPHQCNTFTLQGDYYGGAAGQKEFVPNVTPPFYGNLFAEDIPLDGQNVLGRWTHAIDDETNWTFQSYYDRTNRDQSVFHQELNTLDVDFQYRFPLGCRHKMICGANYRQLSDKLIGDGFAIAFNPPRRTTDVFSAFVQDEITLVDDLWYFTAGSKFERNDYTGFEFQPSGRLLFTPDHQHSFWAAVSRAVRTPSRFDENGLYTLPRQSTPLLPFPIFPQLRGTPGVHSEQMISYEIGYREQTSRSFSWDVATFFNVYEDLESGRWGMPYVVSGEVILPLYFDNGQKGQLYGMEVAGNWTLSESWRVAASYSHLEMQLHTMPGYESSIEGILEGTSPQNQVRLQTYWDLPGPWEFDMAFRYVDSLPAIYVHDYITMDARLGWVPSKHLEMCVVGQNLLDSHHMEFGNHPANFHMLATEVQRSVFAKLIWRY